MWFCGATQHSLACLPYAFGTAETVATSITMVQSLSPGACSQHIKDLSCREMFSGALSSPMLLKVYASEEINTS